MTAHTTAFQRAVAVGQDGLVPIPLATLFAAENLGFSLYMHADDGSPRLYREQNYPLESEDLDELQQRGVRILYVPATEHVQYKCYLQESLDHALKNEQISPVHRYEMLHKAARDRLAEIFMQPDTARAVDGAAEVGERMTTLLSGRDVVLSDLFRVMSHDFDTFGHVINVATYCLVLAERLKIRDHSTLDRIAVGALLHDLGKLQVPVAILNKPSRLTESEWEIMHQHPQTGFEFLCSNEDLNWGQLMMVYQHHERLDGQGYPVGVCGTDIHYWAQLCAVADVFEAMTASRPYRHAMPIGDVLEHLDKQAGVGLDKEIVQCLKATMKAQH